MQVRKDGILAIAVVLAIGGLGISQWLRGLSKDGGGAIKRDITILKDGDVIEGTVIVDSLVIPDGVRVAVSDDILIVAKRAVDVAGSLVAMDRGPIGAAHGPEIRVIAGERINVVGEIEGGRGPFALAGTRARGCQRRRGIDHSTRVSLHRSRWTRACRGRGTWWRSRRWW